MIKLYDLALRDPDVRPSPFCWIVKFALLHKELPFETVPLRFAEKDKYPDPGYGKVPVLIDGDEMVNDSAAIIDWLEKEYPDKPLAKTPGERASAAFYAAFMGASFMSAIAPLAMKYIYAGVHEDDKAYFRTSREARFGKSLEDFFATPGCAEKAGAALAPLSAPLSQWRFLGGDTPNLCDYTVFSILMWSRLSASEDLFEPPQAVAAWSERMLDLFDGYARAAKRAS